MKLLVLSDLHVEFAAFAPDIEATQAADVVVLAGDIHKGTQGVVWARRSFPDKEIIYVAGNHEFYGEHWDRLLVEMRTAAAMSGIRFLENSDVVIGGIRFLGATLWTDFEYFGPSRRSQMMREAEYRMMDYRRIMAQPLTVKLVDATDEVVDMPDLDPGIPENAIGVIEAGGTRRAMLSPTHTLLRHRESMAWLKSELERGDPAKTVVVTHHYPSKYSTAPRYSQDKLTAAFGSKLDLELLTQANLWIHGHTHDSCDYRLSDSKRSVRVVCNPRGYPFNRLNNEFENKDFNPSLLIEIDS